MSSSLCSWYNAQSDFIPFVRWSTSSIIPEACSKNTYFLIQWSACSRTGPKNILYYERWVHNELRQDEYQLVQGKRKKPADHNSRYPLFSQFKLLNHSLRLYHLLIPPRVISIANGIGGIRTKFEVISYASNIIIFLNLITIMSKSSLFHLIEPFERSWPGSWVISHQSTAADLQSIIGEEIQK